MFEVGALCESCGIQGYVSTKCQSTFQRVEHANAMQTYNQCIQNNLTQTLATPVGEIT